MDSKHWLGSLQSLRQHGSMRFLHRFSDSALHTVLMLAVLLLTVLALFRAASLGVAVWQLEPVVVQGQSQAQQPAVKR